MDYISDLQLFQTDESTDDEPAEKSKPIPETRFVFSLVLTCSVLGLLLMVLGFASPYWTLIRYYGEDEFSDSEYILDLLRSGVVVRDMYFGLFYLCFTPCLVSSEKPKSILPADVEDLEYRMKETQCRYARECFKINDVMSSLHLSLAQFLGYLSVLSALGCVLLLTTKNYDTPRKGLGLIILALFGGMTGVLTVVTYNTNVFDLSGTPKSLAYRSSGVRLVDVGSLFLFLVGILPLVLHSKIFDLIRAALGKPRRNPKKTDTPANPEDDSDILAGASPRTSDGDVQPSAAGSTEMTGTHSTFSKTETEFDRRTQESEHTLV